MLEDNIQTDFATPRPTDTVYYFHTDHINTPRVITNSSGTVAWRAAYHAFGYAEVDPSSTITNNIRFPGQYFDSETNLHYNWNRYYDPRTGRYLTPDPIGLEGGIDPFVYTDDNPVNWVDREGLLTSGQAFAHYLGRSGSPVNMQFSEIDTSRIQISQFLKVTTALEEGCRNQVIPIDTTKHFSTSGDAALTVGTITLKLKGTLRINCDCTWTFSGNLSSLPDTYDFNRSAHRSAMGEVSTTIGRQFPGKPYTINILGQRPTNINGKLAGAPTCGCGK